jgi:DMSO/TMAO reductase YedYZ molybdopterin-dependent catalytic subunit
MIDRRFSRRQILGAFGAAALAACDSKKPGRGGLGAMERVNRRVQGALFRPGLEANAGDLTPADAFPVYHASPGVPLAPAGWKLKVGGMVDQPIELSLEDLMAMPRTDVRIEHHCVEGWSATADWHGVRLSELAARVGAKRVGYVDFRSFDAGYWTSWDRESAFHEQTLIAYGMNGQPLGPAHGAPVRLYGSVKLGYKQIKYLTEVNFLDRETGGYWEQQGYEWYAGV